METEQTCSVPLHCKIVYHGTFITPLLLLLRIRHRYIISVSETILSSEASLDPFGLHQESRPLAVWAIVIKVRHAILKIFEQLYRHFWTTFSILSNFLAYFLATSELFRSRIWKGLLAETPEVRDLRTIWSAINTTNTLRLLRKSGQANRNF